VNPSENSISWPSMVIERKVVLPALAAAGGRSWRSTDRNHVTRARSNSRWPAVQVGVARWTSLSTTGPKSQISRSKKWIPMLVASPPDRSMLPFQETKYHLPREVT